MLFDLELVYGIYRELPAKIERVRRIFNRPLTLTEKILYSHLFDAPPRKAYRRGVDYVNFAPDRVAMQDATAQMALLQFLNAGKKKTAVPTTVHCDHMTQAHAGAQADLDLALQQNKEVYDFLQSVSGKYGIGYWRPGAGIIHQVILENYAFPGGMMIGTDSHTVNAGGLGMIAIGVGGADAVDVMAGMAWELKMLRLIGVKLTGRLGGWTAPKDIILKVAGILTVKGGTGCILEYFGEGADSLSATGKGTICNMGAEIGATTSVFGYDNKMASYLRITGRKAITDLADPVRHHLRADPEVYQNPDAYYDELIEIDLSNLEPHINGPYTPDAAYPISEFGKVVIEKGYPLTDTLTNDRGEPVKLDEPEGTEIPPAGFDVKNAGYVAPSPDDTDNLMMGAVNDFNEQTNLVKNQLTGSYDKVSQVARHYKANQIESMIVGDENYGEGSSREHAAMEPRHLNVRAVLVKSFARIHDTNLKKQGMLALTFADKGDYDRIREDDVIDLVGLADFAPQRPLLIRLHHADGTREEFPVNHSYNRLQIDRFKAGSALNLIKEKQK